VRCVLTTGLALLLLVVSSSHALSGWQPLPQGEITRIAFGSCAKQWQSQPVWKAVVAARPDLFLFLGDNIYGDWHGEEPFIPTEQSLRQDYGQLAGEPNLAEARGTIPFMATWDNHDYGKHDGGADFEHKEIARQAFLDFFGEPADSPRRQRDGIYDAKIFGPEGRRVQVILLDNRWNRGALIPDTRSKEEREAMGIFGSMGHTPNEDPTATLLGETQWAWLEQQLRKPAEVRLIASGTQIVPDQKGMQEWGNFPLERKRLFDLIDMTGAKGVVLLSGNVHFAELSKTDEGPYPLYDFTSSGMTHVNTTYPKAPNRYRVGGPFIEHNFGLVEIDWTAGPNPSIRLKAIGIDGIGFEHDVILSELR
jgi:alkaline phosphatase D